MKWLIFAKRNWKELLRDPLTLIFSLVFPMGLLLLFTVIQKNIPVPLFELRSLTPGMVVFGNTFLALFASMLVSKDRGTSFLMRLYSSPMASSDFILGYLLPFLPLALCQCALTYGFSALLGLKLTWSMAVSGLLSLLTAVVFVSLGLLLGSVLSEKAVGGVCGALLTNLCAVLSGVWFDLELIGGWFKEIAFWLPFANGVELGRAAVEGTRLTPYLWWCLGYAVVTTAAAIIVFKGKMRVK